MFVYTNPKRPLNEWHVLASDLYLDSIRLSSQSTDATLYPAHGVIQQ
jgi:hypothetical protein